MRWFIIEYNVHFHLVRWSKLAKFSNRVTCTSSQMNVSFRKTLAILCGTYRYAIKKVQRYKYKNMYLNTQDILLVGCVDYCFYQHIHSLQDQPFS